MSLRDRVDERLSTLSAAERRVALVFTDHQPQLGYLSAREIGRMAGVSDATVVRSAQRLGYEGLSGLKAAAAEELAAPSLSERLRDSLAADDDGPLEHMVSRHLDSLERLATPDMSVAINEAVGYLVEAQRILLVGSGPSAPIAEYGAHLLVRIGLDARAIVHSGVAAADDLAGLRGGDVIVLLAYTHLAPHVSALLTHAEHLGLSVVLLTDTLPAPSGDSVVLRTGRGGPSGAASHVTTVATLETLSVMAADRDPERSTATLDELNRFRSQIARLTTTARE